MFTRPHSHYIAISVKFSDFVHTSSPRRAQTLMSVCDYAGVIHRISRKIQRNVILPMLLECSLNLNTSTCMQYVASLLDVNDNFQIKSMVIGIFFNLQNVSFLCNCGGLAIIVSKKSYMLQYTEGL